MISEVFRGFQKFSEVFQRPSQRPSQSAIFLSELRVVLPLIVLPPKTLATLSKEVQEAWGGVWVLQEGSRLEGGGWGSRLVVFFGL